MGALRPAPPREIPAVPDAPDLRFMSALKARRQGDKDAARAQLEAILEAEPDHADALEVLGMMVSEEGDLDRAIQLTERLVELAPQSIMAHANLSRFHMLKGDKETAEEWQAKARVLGWKEEVGRKNANNPGGLDQGVDPDMLEKQEQAVEKEPDSVIARLTLGRSYLKLGMPAKAIGHLRHALKRDPDMSVLYLELGKALEAANMKADALQLYREGVQVADRKGDLMPRNQMASRRVALEKETSSP